MIVTVIKFLAAITTFFMLLQFFLYATNRASAADRKAYCMPLGILLFILAIAGFASRDPFLVFLSVGMVALSLWLGPTSWLGKQKSNDLLLGIPQDPQPDRFLDSAYDAKPCEEGKAAPESEASNAAKC